MKAVIPGVMATCLLFPMTVHACGLAALDPIALDRNGNAEISRDEAAGTTLAWAFDAVDSNGDGIVNQAEFAARCATYGNPGSQAAREPTAVEAAAIGKAEELKERQQGRIGQRIDQETDSAVDGIVNKGFNKLFGR